MLLMNKPVYLSLSILNLSKTVTLEDVTPPVMN